VRDRARGASASPFRDWGAERTRIPKEVTEMSLAHTIPTAVEAVYRRRDLCENRHRLMEAGSQICAAPDATGEVVPISTRW
jgi:hypothetical protein